MRLLDVKLSVQIQPVREVARSRGQVKFRVEVYRSGQRRLVGLHRQAQQVFNPAFVDGHVERDFLALLVFVLRLHHAALGHDDCIQQARSHRVQQGVSVGSVHGGAEVRLQIERMPADGHGEVGSRGLAFYFDLLQHAAKFPVGRKNAADAFEVSQVSLVERVLGCQRRLAGIVRAPRAEASLGLDFARRHCVGKLRGERGGAVKPDRMHHQMVNGEDVGIFVGGFGQQPKFRVVGDNFSDQHGNVLRLWPILVPSLSLGRNLYDQSLERDLVHLPRLPGQSQNAGLGRELLD